MKWLVILITVPLFALTLLSGCGDDGNDDLCPDDPAKTEPGVCGCGSPDTDTDSDGTMDCNDSCADDPDKTDPGTCGCGGVDGTPGALDGAWVLTNLTCDGTAMMPPGANFIVRVDGTTGSFSQVYAPGCAAFLNETYEYPCENTWLIIAGDITCSPNTLCPALFGGETCTPVPPPTEFSYEFSNGGATVTFTRTAESPADAPCQVGQEVVYVMDEYTPPGGPMDGVWTVSSFTCDGVDSFIPGAEFTLTVSNDVGTFRQHFQDGCVALLNETYEYPDATTFRINPQDITCDPNATCDFGGFPCYPLPATTDFQYVLSNGGNTVTFNRTAASLDDAPCQVGQQVEFVMDKQIEF